MRAYGMYESVYHVKAMYSTNTNTGQVGTCERDGGGVCDENLLRHRTSLFMTNAPTRTRTIESRKTTVAMTRIGLNICGRVS